MKDMKPLVKRIIEHLKIDGYIQEEGYGRFSLDSIKDDKVTVRRANGEESVVSFSDIQKGLEAVKENPSVYYDGPDSLKLSGIRENQDVIWTMLHLLPLDDITNY